MKQTPKKKAEELVLNYMPYVDWNGFDDKRALINAKQCVFIAVNEILNSSPLNPNFADWDDCGGEHRYWYDAQKTQALHFWQKVKEEIEKL
jgi:hypothetical protein